jgi:hypothetical protein
MIHHGDTRKTTTKVVSEGLETRRFNMLGQFLLLFSVSPCLRG